MTKQLALDLGDQDLGARRRRVSAGPRATATAATPLGRAGRGSRSSRPEPGTTPIPASGSRAPRGGDRSSAGPARTSPRVPVVDEQWRLDEHTRQVGLEGVAEARRVLAALAVPDAA